MRRYAFRRHQWRERQSDASDVTDHGRLESRLRPMRGSNAPFTRVMSAGHAFIQNLRRGHFERGLDANRRHRQCLCWQYTNRLAGISA